MMLLQRAIILLMACLIHFNTSCQDWQPFVADKSYTWTQNDGGQLILESIEVDTTDDQGADTLFLHSVVCESWNSATALEFYSMNNYGYNSQIVNYDKPAIVTREGDHVMILDFNRVSEDWWQFEFRPYSHQGDTWETNGLDFICESESVNLIFGQADSIKTFRCLTAPFDTIKFVLSKSHGFVQYSPLRNFHDTDLVELRPYFELSGTRDTLGDMGFNQPQFVDYFNLKVDDILVWKDVRNSFYNDTSYLIDTILEVIETEDEVTYRTLRTRYDQDWKYVGQDSSTLRYKLEFEGAILESQISWIANPIWTFYSLDRLVVKVNNGDTNIIAGFWNTGLFNEDDSCEFTFVFDIYDAWYFSTKKGMTGYNSCGVEGCFSRSLIGSVIDGIGEGVVEIPNSVSAPRHIKLELFPNPTNSFVHFTNTDVEFEAIKIFDIQGRLVNSVRMNSNTMDLVKLNPGVYFLHVFDKTGKIYLGTVIKE